MITVSILWGLYQRTTDGRVVYERWLWGAYLRVRPTRPTLQRTSPHGLSREQSQAFGALGGVMLQDDAVTQERRLEKTLELVRLELQARMDSQAAHIERAVRTALAGPTTPPITAPVSTIPDLTEERDDEDTGSAVDIFLP